MPSVSDLRREFETPPYSRQVALGTQVEMRCHPPKGKPTPMVTWLKNGSPVREGGNGNLLVTGAGHLIVVKTRWADAANYSCVAENVAARRVSQAAQLAVYGKINFKLPHVPSNHMSITFNQSGFYLRRSHAGQWMINLLVAVRRFNHLMEAFRGQRSMAT